MGRAQPRSAAAVAEVRRFIAALRLADGKLCVEHGEAVLKMRRKLLGRKRKGSVTGEAFLKALSRLGAQRSRLRGGAPYKWCFECAHTVQPFGKGKRTRADCADEDSVSADVAASGDEDTVTDEDQSEDEDVETDWDERDETDWEDEEDEDSSTASNSCDDTHTQPGISMAAYKRLHKRYERLKRRTILTRRSLYGADGAYSPGVIVALQILRGHGIGAESCGKTLSDILEAIIGTRGKGKKAISKKTVKRSDTFSGPMSTGRFLEKIRSLGGQVQMSMDASSGSRKQKGLKVSQVGLSTRNPNSDSGRVLQVLADSSVGEGGLTEEKAVQIGRTQRLAEDFGFETPKLCVVDHENAAGAACDVAGVTKAGCSSHKWKHSIEAVPIDDEISDAMETLHTASCASSTNATTSTGIKMTSSLFAENKGGIPRGFKLGRQVGNKYGWLCRSCACVLHNRDRLQEAVRRKELYIPDSDALDVLLADDTIPQLVVSAICYAWFKATLTLLKKDPDHEGELPVLKARELYPELRGWLVTLSKARGFPRWICEKAGKNPLGLEQARVHFSSDAASLLRVSARCMLARFDEFVEKDEELSPRKAKDLQHSNDFIEGGHSTFSQINDRLPNVNPQRAISITQRKHNQAALRAVDVPLVPSPDTFDRYKRRRLESNESVMDRVHATSMRQQMRTDFKKIKADEVRQKALDVGLPVEADGRKITRKDQIEALINLSYSPPSLPEADPIVRKLF